MDYFKNKKVYTFYLNENAKFHNGNTVTAEDVAWSISRHFWPKSDSFSTNSLKSILKEPHNISAGKIHSSIKVIGKHTLEFSLKNPYSPFVYILSSAAFSVINKENFDPFHPIGSGAFEPHFDFNKRNWIMKKNKNYSNLAPKINIINFINIDRSKI